MLSTDNNVIIRDMPKLEAPFVRVQVGKRFLVTPEINPGYEWVFEDPNVLATEKLDGTCVCVVVNGGRVTALYNRLNPVTLDALVRGPVIDGVREANMKGYIPTADGYHFGELMGPEVQKNFLGLEAPLWIPFERVKARWAYRSFHEHPKTFEGISEWFEKYIFSLARSHYRGDKVPPEGVVFHHPDGRMAKLRRDMFPWYRGKGHKEAE